MRYCLGLDLIQSTHPLAQETQWRISFVDPTGHLGAFPRGQYTYVVSLGTGLTCPLPSIEAYYREWIWIPELDGNLPQLEPWLQLKGADR